MSIVRNNSKRLILVDDKKLVPGRASSDIDVEKAKKKFPSFAKMVESGEIEVITAAQAKAIEKDFEERSKADLIDYAKENGIDIAGLTKKADIVAVIKAAKDKQYEGK